ncbi:hypothetical protein HYH03_005471 [Edaphochlamys debaryana]|uniref:Cyclic nucleotide-binding domain-containing protein n=1 Tax=Edaphochlamys debaryana TaxID=47281 RepID=A0A835Y608_9CHLO|nr:hypothetical protein HYH03_005471 [Edaphochlamys debaryana]|eukprot:KAG2496651.1 hypothetical protein HYH03_005471 [Edaphochlamys debaryana]
MTASSWFLRLPGSLRHLQVPQPAAHLQTVEESNEHRAPQNHDHSAHSVYSLQEKPSQRNLARQAQAPAEPYKERDVYAQEGDGLRDNDAFKETVAELLEEQEYGVFRLVVPCARLPRTAFNNYVEWLNCQRVMAKGQAGGPPVRALSTRSIFGLPLIQPFAPFALGWTCLMMIVDLTWTAFGVPINVAFCSVDYGHIHSSCTATDLTFGTIYFLNLLLSFQLGVMVVNGHRKKTCMDGPHVAIYYMRYGRFILDVAATIPLFYLIAILSLSDGQGYSSKWVNALSLLRLLRLLRLVSVSKVIYLEGALGGNGWLGKYFDVTRMHIVMVAYQTMVMINFLACLLVLMAYIHDPEDSWMTAVEWVDLPNSAKPYQWFCAVYWIITTTTTTGFGDFAPRWWGEQVVIAAAMIIGMVIFGILVGTITNVIARANNAAIRLQAHMRKISQVNQWLHNATGLKPHFKLRIQEYFAQVFVAKQSVEYGEAELFTDLPPYLRFEAASELSLPLIQSVHALRSLNLDAQQLLAAHMRPVRAIVGQELCRQGDEADRLWLLCSGRMVALRHKEPPQHITAPALVGESLILALDVPQCRHRPWTLRTASPCSLWELRLHDLSRVVSIYPAIRLSLLEHVRKELVKHLFTMSPSAHGEVNPAGPVQPMPDWCELVALLEGALDCLQGEPSVRFEELCMQLERANIDDDSLKSTLAEMVEGAMVRDGLGPEAVMGYPLHVQEQMQAQQAAERSVSLPVGHPLAPAESGALNAVSTAFAANGRTSSHLPNPSPSTAGPNARSAKSGITAPWQWLTQHDTHKGPAPWDMGPPPEEPAVHGGAAAAAAGVMAAAAAKEARAQASKDSSVAGGAAGGRPPSPPPSAGRSHSRQRDASDRSWSGARASNPPSPSRTPRTHSHLQQRYPLGVAGALALTTVPEPGSFVVPNPTGPGFAGGLYGSQGAAHSVGGGALPPPIVPGWQPPSGKPMPRVRSAQRPLAGTSTGMPYGAPLGGGGAGGGEGGGAGPAGASPPDSAQRGGYWGSGVPGTAMGYAGQAHRAPASAAAAALNRGSGGSTALGVAVDAVIEAEGGVGGGGGSGGGAPGAGAPAPSAGGATLPGGETPAGGSLHAGTAALAQLQSSASNANVYSAAAAAAAARAAAAGGQLNAESAPLPSARSRRASVDLGTDPIAQETAIPSPRLRPHAVQLLLEEEGIRGEPEPTGTGAAGAGVGAEEGGGGGGGAEEVEASVSHLPMPPAVPSITPPEYSAAAALSPHGPSRLAPQPPNVARLSATAAAASGGGAGPAGPVPAPGLPTPPQPPIAAMGAAARRSILSRMSPFATAWAGAAGNLAATSVPIPGGQAGGPAYGTAVGPPSPSRGPSGAHHPSLSGFGYLPAGSQRSAGGAPPQAAGTGPAPSDSGAGTGGGAGAGPGAAPMPTAPCAHCGCSACPACGSWMPPPGTALMPMHTHPMASGPPPASLGVGGSVTGAGPSPALCNATSLLEAFRGPVRQRTALGGGSLTQFGTVPPAAQAQSHSALWGGAAVNPTASPARPTAGLARRSRMYGRSYTTAARMDSLARQTLMRETLQRDTIWQAYAAEEDDL